MKVILSRALLAIIQWSSLYLAVCQSSGVHFKDLCCFWTVEHLNQWFSSADMYIIPQICCLFPIWPSCVCYSLYTNTYRSENVTLPLLFNSHFRLNTVSSNSFWKQENSGSINAKFTSHKVITRT